MENIKDFTTDQLREYFDAKIQMKMLLEQMSFQTSNEDLRHAFEIQAKNIESQLQKIEKIFSALNLTNEGRRSEVMEAITNEAHHFTEKTTHAEVRDAGLIAIAQKAKHYEIALCGTLRDYAHEMGNEMATTLLAALLSEEKENDKSFTQKARGGINQRATDTTQPPGRFASTGLHTDE